jgi:hypothetical protein
MIRLFIDYFNSPLPARRQEYEIALRKNLENRFINAVYVIGRDLSPEHDKITRVHFDGRPTYQQFFDFVNGEPSLLEGDISIIANLDIFFDDTIAVVAGMQPNQCYALSRWDAGRIEQINGDSQDSWIFRGRIRPVGYADFRMGTWGCDNRIAHELWAAGYHVLNPAQSILSHHVHQSNIRQGEARRPDNTVPPPYLYVHPCAI